MACDYIRHIQHLQPAPNQDINGGRLLEENEIDLTDIVLTLPVSNGLWVG
jgi:hypothetical protein